ncbi:glycosyltransferase family 52 [Scandinavium goeteborgense]|uniref:glycosyltransferase family 52 n=1 Tax=Scandinavium goeteborgense TaxID=1851514 RepID=UPI0038293B0C
MDLYICFTPLQSLIASQILERSNNSAALFYYTDTDNEKNRHYFNSLSEKMKLSKYYSRKFSIILLIKLFLFAKKLRTVNTVYLASVDNQIVHYLLSYLDFNRIITFDDGTANISYNSLFYRRIETSKFKRIIHFLFGRQYYREKVIEESLLHYSIYKNKRNIHSFVEHIPLLNTNNIATGAKNKRIKSIFLGTVYRDVANTPRDANLLHCAVLSFLSGLDDVIYLPHPRERNTIFEDYTLCTENIAEDVIINYLKQGFNVDVYGFGSSAQFNILNINGIKCYVCMSNLINPDILNLCHEIVEMGAISKNLDDLDHIEKL